MTPMLSKVRRFTRHRSKAKPDSCGVFFHPNDVRCVLKTYLCPQSPVRGSPPQKVTPMFFEIMIYLLHLVAIWLVIFILGHLSEVFEVFSLGKCMGKVVASCRCFFCFGLLLWTLQLCLQISGKDLIRLILAFPLTQLGCTSTFNSWGKSLLHCNATWQGNAVYGDL